MEQLVDRYTAITLVIVALSHIAQPKAWTRFFRVLLKTGIAPIAIAMYTFPLGLVLLLVHQDWTWGWHWAFLFLGLAYTLKSVIYLLYPSLADRTIREKGLQPANYKLAGMVMLPLSGLLCFAAFRTG